MARLLDLFSGIGGFSLAAHAAGIVTTRVGGSLNPDWVDALMGYPIGYTRLDGDPMRDIPARWPAGLGCDQHDWEPPRLTTVKENRPARLKALGNSIVPQVACRWMAAIAADCGVAS